MKNIVQPLKKFNKNTAIELRKKGLSYSEIQKHIKIPKSTLSLWLKNIDLTSNQQKNLKNKRDNIAKENSRKRILKTAQMIEKIKDASARDVNKITKRELWLMGIILYWKERLSSGNDTDLKNGVRFTSSDPNLIKLFLKWLKEVGGIKEDEIKFDLFLKKDQDLSTDTIKQAVLYWSGITSFHKDKFLQHIYFQKVKEKDNKNNKAGQHAQTTASRTRGKNMQTNMESTQQISHQELSTIKNKTPYGLLRVRVRASSMLARQIAGWAEGIQKII